MTCPKTQLVNGAPRIRTQVFLTLETSKLLAKWKCVSVCVHVCVSISEFQGPGKGSLGMSRTCHSFEKGASPASGQQRTLCLQNLEFPGESVPT